MLPMAFIRLVAVGIFLLLLCTSSSAQIALDAQFPLQTDLNSVSNLTASCQQAVRILPTRNMSNENKVLTSGLNLVYFIAKHF